MENQEQPVEFDHEQTPVAQAAAADDGALSEPAEAPAWQSLLEQMERGQSAQANDPLVQLVNEYKEAIKARDEWADKYLRAAAEFANARRRAEVRADNQVWTARERLLKNVLPVLDDFERAFSAIPEAEMDSPWVEGFALIQRKLWGVLEREGVVEIVAAGQSFDPTLHQAVLVEADGDAESGAVLDVLQRGYLLDDKVLRPSLVKVAQ